MFTFHFKPLIAIAMISSLFFAQFAHVPHVHAGSWTDSGSRHTSRAHVHVGHSEKSKHAHPHSHSHAHKCTAPCNSKTHRLSLALTVDHDQDAVYLAQSPVPFSPPRSFQLEHIQPNDYQSISLSFWDNLNLPTVSCCNCWHPPDKYRLCPIYLLTLSIRC